MPVGEYQARKYMRLANNQEVIAELKRARSPVSIDQADKAIGQALRPPAEPPHQAVIDLMNVDKAEEVYERLDGSGEPLISRVNHRHILCLARHSIAGKAHSSSGVAQHSWQRHTSINTQNRSRLCLAYRGEL